MFSHYKKLLDFNVFGFFCQNIESQVDLPTHQLTTISFEQTHTYGLEELYDIFTNNLARNEKLPSQLKILIKNTVESQSQIHNHPSEHHTVLHRKRYVGEYNISINLLMTLLNDKYRLFPFSDQINKYKVDRNAHLLLTSFVFLHIEIKNDETNTWDRIYTYSKKALHKLIHHRLDMSLL